MTTYLLRSVVLFVLCWQMNACDNVQKKIQHPLQKGDLLFQDLDSDSITDAIESVTGGEQKLSFSHVGILDYDEQGKPVVLEAVSKGVVYTGLDDFLMRSRNKAGKPKVAVARLTSNLTSRIEKALEYGRTLIGKNYDSVYVLGDENYYCSELIYELFANTGDSSEVFVLKPMTFKDPDTGEFLPFWMEYYQQLGIEIPEGKPGLNPNGMFQSENIELVFRYDSE